jgi:hypothetical protein
LVKRNDWLTVSNSLPLILVTPSKFMRNRINYLVGGTSGKDRFDGKFGRIEENLARIGSGTGN